MTYKEKQKRMTQLCSRKGGYTEEEEFFIKEILTSDMTDWELSNLLHWKEDSSSKPG